MKVTGIIAEYNPFHQGHAYHLSRARELTGADRVIWSLWAEISCSEENLLS